MKSLGRGSWLWAERLPSLAYKKIIPKSRTNDIRELLLELTRKQVMTVFMSSHILAEVSRLAGRIGISHKGRLLQELNTEVEVYRPEPLGTA
jgi:ABC-type oligopeptide transport system ATPase subunit